MGEHGMDGPWAIACGRLIDGTGRPPIEGAVIRICGGRVEAVETVLRDETVTGLVDWTGYTVLPGMVDAHDHLTLDVGDEEAQCNEPELWRGLRGAGNAQRVIRAGVTTVRDCGARGYVDIALRRALTDGVIEGPRLLVSGVPLTVKRGHCWFLGGEVGSRAEIRQAVRTQVEAGVDFIKVFVTGGVVTRGSALLSPQFSRSELEDVVTEAHAAGRRVIAHCHGGPGAEWAIDVGVDSIEHGVFFAAENLAAMVAKGIPLVVTCGVFERLATEASVESSVREHCRKAAKLYSRTIALARATGVTVALGSDTVHGALVAEMRAGIGAGLTPLDAIVAGTRNGARVCGLTDVGTVEPGMRADLIAVEGNPIVDIDAVCRVVHVVQQGRLLETALK